MRLSGRVRRECWGRARVPVNTRCTTHRLLFVFPVFSVGSLSIGQVEARAKGISSTVRVPFARREKPLHPFAAGIVLFFVFPVAAVVVAKAEKIQQLWLTSSMVPNSVVVRRRLY